MKKSSLRERLKQEVYERQGKVRYYSGFNLEGFFLGYDPEKQRFDKAKMSPQRHVWFYLDPRIVVIGAKFQPVDIGADEDHYLYFKSNSLRKNGTAIMRAAATGMNFYQTSYKHPDVQPCVFSGLIPLEEVADGGAGNSWFRSRGSCVPVDRLYKVTEKIDKKTGNRRIRKIINISHRL